MHFTPVFDKIKNTINHYMNEITGSRTVAYLSKSIHVNLRTDDPYASSRPFHKIKDHLFIVCVVGN